MTTIVRLGVDRESGVVYFELSRLSELTHMLRPLAAGYVYRNPVPHLTAIHAWHPSLVRLSGGSLLATFDLAQAVEGLDYHTCQSRSNDGGRTWSQPAPLFQDTTTR